MTPGRDAFFWSFSRCNRSTTFFVMRTRSLIKNGLVMKSSTPSTSGLAGHRPPAAAQLSCPPSCPPRPPRGSLPRAQGPALHAGLLGENDVRDFHPFIEGFAHVVDCEGSGGNGDQGFHFHARLGGR